MKEKVICNSVSSPIFIKGRKYVRGENVVDKKTKKYLLENFPGIFSDIRKKEDKK